MRFADDEMCRVVGFWIGVRGRFFCIHCIFCVFIGWNE